MPLSHSWRIQRRLWSCRACARQFATRRGSSHALPTFPARTRFAPSPTGNLHLGSLRTALFNYLLARATGGQFLLRIEDTDKKRTIPGAEERLYDDLRWAGLNWDEGPQAGGPYGPYRQSERTPVYREHVETLLKSGHAYRCFCSAQRLQEISLQRRLLGLPVEYDRACIGISSPESDDRADKGERYAVRLKAPDEYPEIQDLVYGRVGKKMPRAKMPWTSQVAYEDTVLLKSDGQPTYHLANVVDDHLMQITHVVRGLEWMSATPKHLFLYQAFGWKPPEFAHVGLLQDKTRQKLSKRNYDIDIAAYRRLGVLPEALVNYIALLGWSHKESSDVMTLGQLIEKFNLKFTKDNTIVALEKLWYLQRAHALILRDKDGERFAALAKQVYEYVEEHLTEEQRGTFLRSKDLAQYVKSILRANAKNFRTLEDFLQQNIYFFTPIINSHYNVRTADGKLIHTTPVDDLINGATQFQNIDAGSWTSETIQKIIEQVVMKAAPRAQEAEATVVESHKERIERIKRNRAWNQAFYHYLRWALAEGKLGPGVAEIMEILGKDESLSRLTQAAALAGSST